MSLAHQNLPKQSGHTGSRRKPLGDDQDVQISRAKQRIDECRRVQNAIEEMQWDQTNPDLEEAQEQYLRRLGVSLPKVEQTF